VRGYRVELGEIEATLRGYPQVKAAVVLLREDVPGQQLLVAYVAADEGAGITAAGLRAHLAERLPDYMVPGAFVGMEKLRSTPTARSTAARSRPRSAGRTRTWRRDGDGGAAGRDLGGGAGA
jgi:acyl-CoA synthetase (AMP-forming)/AMP-acid ligase II